MPCPAFLVSHPHMAPAQRGLPWLPVAVCTLILRGLLGYRLLHPGCPVQVCVHCLFSLFTPIPRQGLQKAEHLLCYLQQCLGHDGFWLVFIQWLNLKEMWGEKRTPISGSTLMAVRSSSPFPTLWKISVEKSKSPLPFPASFSSLHFLCPLSLFSAVHQVSPASEAPCWVSACPHGA